MHAILRQSLIIFSILCVTACADTPTKKNAAAPDPGKRSLSEFVDDEKLTSSVYRKITRSDVDFSETHIRVTCFKGLALLTGEVPEDTLKADAGRLAQSVEGVREIHNELQLKSNSTMFSRTNDNGLEAKIRVKLLADRDVEGSKVHIVVEDRVVYLMGLLTREQAKLATEIVANVSGIERVVRVVDYLD